MAPACGGGSGATSTTSTATATTVATTTTVAATTTSASATTTGVTTQPPSGDAQLEMGRVIWEETYLHDGCQECHGPDARGTADVPNIRGVSRTKIVDALVDVEEMQWEVKLTSAEIDADWAYVQYLSNLP